jgi:hypothetical protein
MLVPVADTSTPPENVMEMVPEVRTVWQCRIMLDHASGPSRDGTERHRRILHLEFAADANLPDGYRWFHFLPPHRSLA